jgi:hypothetical protein
LFATSIPAAIFFLHLSLCRRAEIKKHKEAMAAWEEAAQISRTEAAAKIAKRTSEIYKKAESLLAEL